MYLRLLGLVLLASNPVFAGNVAFEQAKDAGVKKCLPSIKKTAQFLTKDEDYSVENLWNKKFPDHQIFSSAFEINTDDSDPTLTFMEVVPLKSGECAVAYTKILFQKRACGDVLLDFLRMDPTFKDSNPLGKKVLRVGPNGANSAYVLTAGNGCIVVRREIQENGNQP